MFFAHLTPIVIVLACVPVEPLCGQSTASKGSSFWFRGGYDSPTGIGLELAFQRNIFIVEGRFTGKEVIPDDAAGGDLALLIGLAPIKERNFHVSLTGGVAITALFDDPFCVDDGRVCLKSPVPALAISFHGSYRPAPFLGIGFFVHANLNSEKSFGGSGLMIELGKLR